MNYKILLALPLSLLVAGSAIAADVEAGKNELHLLS